VLEHQCRWLRRHGVERLVVALCADVVEVAQAPGRVEGIEVLWRPEPVRQGTGGCLRGLSGLLRDEPFILLHQNVVPGDLDLGVLVHEDFADRELLRVLVREQPIDRLHAVEVDSLGAVATFPREHASRDSHRHFHAGYRVEAVATRAPVALLDTPEDYLALMRSQCYALPAGNEVQVLPRVWARGAVEIAPSAQIIGPVLLGDGVLIERDACVIGPACLGDGVSVGKGAVVRESALWRDSAVSEGASVDFSILAEGQHLLPGEAVFASVHCEEGARFDPPRAMPWDRGAPLAPLRTETGGERAYAIGKRALDLVGAAAGLLLLFPVALAIGIAIRLDSRGPVFYRDSRCGRQGRAFRMWKFRTMGSGASRLQDRFLESKDTDGPIFKLDDDPRVTRVGALLRRTSLDELPQLVNILKGEMSFVGPRPLKMDEMRCAPQWRDLRLSVKPGLTGLWQLHARHSTMFGDWVRYDNAYVLDGPSLLGDLRIILTTMRKVLTGKINGR
jgi:lipopolysaccharide/colanic/teichoic acid biosynthesis glycosyltransferase